VTDRDVRILEDVAEFGLMTREQIRRRQRFGSLTRVNTTLLRLVRAGYLSRRFQPTLTGWRRALYYIGPAGLQLLGDRGEGAAADRRRLAEWSDLFVEHHILVNEVRLAFADCRYPDYACERWMTETALQRLRVPVKPDGFVEYAVRDRSFAAFLELDRGTESSRRWRQKTEAYLTFAGSGRYERIFGRRFFRVLVVVPTVQRLERLQREIGRYTHEIFWLATIPELLAQGPLACIWSRPADRARHALTEG
jgi:hypothetical protein